MKNILLATDLGANSDRALERALKIAKEHEAKLHIVYVAPPYPNPKKQSWATTFESDTKEDIRGYLHDYKDSSDVDVEITVKLGGEAFFEILEAAYTHKADLIVMGMHSKEPFRDLFTGTTIERVIRKGITPVLMVKEKPAGPYQSILSAIDFAPGSRSALRVGMALAPDAVFEVAHVVIVPVVSVPMNHSGASFIHEHMRETAEDTATKNMEAFLKTERTHFAKEHNGQDKRLSGKLLDVPVYDALIEHAASLKADLITIGTHGKPGIFPKLGGTAGDILSKPPCDVLVASERFHD